MPEWVPPFPGGDSRILSKGTGTAVGAESWRCVGMRTVAVVITVIWLTAGLPIGGGAWAPPSTIRLGAVVPLTGRYASGGAQVKVGYEFALQDINGRGRGVGWGRGVRVAA